MTHRTLILLATIAMALAACTTPITTAPTNIPTLAAVTATPLPTSKPEPTALPVEHTSAQLAAIRDLSALLNLPPDQIQVTSTQAVEWRNGCIGVQPFGVLCTPNIVPGYRITLSANSEMHRYHTNQDGSAVVNVTNAATMLQVAVLAPDHTFKLIDTGLAGGAAAIGFPTLGDATLNTLFALDVTEGASAYAINDSGTYPLDFVQNPTHGLAVWAGSGELPTKLAWASTTASAVELYISNPDGSELQTVLSESLTGTPPPYQFVVLGWSADGTGLYFSRVPDGIGGYTPFPAFATLQRYNLSDGRITDLIPFDPKNGLALCRDDLSTDGNLLVDHCDDTINIHNLSKETFSSILPPTGIAGWGVLGTARLSPDNSRAAFALAKRDPENEQGWVAISTGLAGPSQVILTSEPGTFFSVVGWLNTDTLLIQKNSVTQCNSACESSLWMVNADGQNLTKLADGSFIAFVNGW